MNKATTPLLSLLTLLAICAPCAASHEPHNPPNNPKSNWAERLGQKAAALYAKSKADKEGQPQQPEAPVLPVAPPAQPAPEPVTIKPAPDAITASNPIMGKHRQFADEWWEALFNPCKGCSYRTRNSSTPIDCEKMLNDNPQWKDVKAMKYSTRRIIMERAMLRFYHTQDSCNLACAVCADGDPDTRLPDPKETLGRHTALHLVSGGLDYDIAEDDPNNHFHNPLFRLLLTKGADPKLKCLEQGPTYWVRDECKKDLAKAIAKKDN